MKFSILSFLCVFPLLLGTVDAGEKKTVSHELSEWKFGDALFGDDLAPAKLRGKVVVVEYWGAKCSSCLQGMSKLTALDDKYRSKGLRVIAAEAHQSAKEQIAQVVAERKMKFSVTSEVKGPISILGLPHAVIFGSDGKLLFSGHPNDERFEKTVEAAMVKMKEPSAEKMTEGRPTVRPRERVWKNHEGKPLVASLRRIDGDKVIFRLKNGTEVPYEIKKLSSKDQELIRSQSARKGK